MRALTWPLSLFVAALLCAPASAEPQPPPPPPPPGVIAGMPPPRDNASSKPGTAVIRGRVLAADTGQPLRKVFIRLGSPELREGRVASTDIDGRYELKELPAGRYTLTASKGSFVQLAYGQLRPFEPGRPLEVADGQTIEKVDFSLPRGGIITGRVLDEFGEPVADAQVAPMRYVSQGGRRRMQPSGRMAMTNDIGEYRIFGLPPGSYYISATMRGGMMMNAQSDDRSGYAPTYYPGTASTAEAQKIALGLGQTLNDINVTLIPTRVASVSGIIFDAQGRPLAGGMVMVIQRQGSNGFSMNTGGMIRPDGTFTVNGLAPGDYTLQANGMPGAIGSFDSSEFATADITVNGDDITGVRLASMHASAVTGRIVFSDPKAAGVIRPAQFRVNAMPRDPETFSPFAGGPGRVNEDFTFEIKARPARVLIRVNMLFASGAGGGGSWVMKAVRLNGLDVTDTGIEVKANEDLSGLEIEMTNRLTETSGIVTNARGEAVKDYSIVIFARDRERWVPNSRFLRTGRPDQDGRFKVVGLPAGAYYAIALDYIDPADDTSDPEFLDRLRDRAAGFSLSDGETKMLDLKLATMS
jgi:Carboxypeptidase regulatory-like domain